MSMPWTVRQQKSCDGEHSVVSLGALVDRHSLLGQAHAMIMVTHA